MRSRDQLDPAGGFDLGNPQSIVTESGQLCYAANAIPTRSRYAGTYAAAIAGRYGWEGLHGRSGDGLRMVSRVSVGGAGRSGDGLRMVSRVSL